MSVHAELSLRRRTADDDPFLVQLFREQRAPEFALLGLAPAMLDSLLSMQYRAQIVGYATQFPQAEDQVIWWGETRIGRLMVDRSPRAHHLLNVALVAGMQGHGWGTKIVRELIGEARSKGVALRLQVRPGNPAVRLYQRLGFVVTGGDGVNVSMELAPDRSAQVAEVSEDVRRPPAAPPEPGTTAVYFRSLSGESLEGRPPDGLVVQLTLVAVEPLRLEAKPQDIEMGDSFVLRLWGPVQPALPAATISISHKGAHPLDVFIVPVACSPERMEYEAIFNRSVRTGRARAGKGDRIG